MRVVHIITRLIVGGAQENTAASVLGLRQKPGLEVHLITGLSEGPEGSLETKFSGCPEVLEILPELVRPVNPWKDGRALQRLTAILRAMRPDVVHTHSGKAGVIGRLAAARVGVPIIVHTIHGPSFGSFQGPLANLAFRAAERYAARVTTHFVVVADAMKQQYLAAGIGHPAQYTRIFSGFALEPFLEARNDLQLRASLGLGPEDIVVGKIARLVGLKGHDDLFAAAPALVKSCPRLKFLLVGDGDWRGRFEAQTRSLGLQQHFVFAGLVAPEKVASLMGVMDIVTHLSAREGLPRALPQALAAGRPVVAYDRDGAREVCLDKETGFLVRPGDLVLLRQRLLELAGDPALRARLGERGRQFVRERFGVQQMVDELHRLYLRLADQAQPQPLATA
ncbi:MAG TPA: glycosyltransferase family 4 protein [Verrucomicrobiae bacterium]|nr:glycosyltransferase family 4 protein [Verrucomicrobiae bacterium]